MKGLKVSYWISTGLLSLMMLFSAGMYIFNNTFVIEAFVALGYPTYLIYPLAIAKLLGVVAILFVANKRLKTAAYAGFVYTAILGIFAHLAVNDGEFAGALVFLILVIVSYTTGRKLKRV